MKERYKLWDLELDGSVLKNGFCKNSVWMYEMIWTASKHSFCQHNDEHLGFIGAWQFFSNWIRAFLRKVLYQRASELVSQHYFNELHVTVHNDTVI